MTSYLNQNAKNEIIDKIPLGRLGTSDDVAKLVLETVKTRRGTIIDEINLSPAIKNINSKKCRRLNACRTIKSFYTRKWV